MLYQQFSSKILNLLDKQKYLQTLDKYSHDR